MLAVISLVALLGLSLADNPCNLGEEYSPYSQRCYSVGRITYVGGGHGADYVPQIPTPGELSIHNEEDYEILASLVGQGQFKKIILGLEKINGTWMWLDGTPLDHTNWAEGEPRDICFKGRPCDCAYFEADGEENKWWSYSCQRPPMYVRSASYRNV